MRKFGPRKDAETSGVFKFPADSHADAVVLYHSEDFARVIECNLFEWSLRAGISVPFCPEYQLLESDLRPVESVLEPESVRLRMLEDMVQYYRSRPVNDDDLELISSVMSRAYDYIEGTDGSSDAFRSERFAPLVGAYERSLLSLEAHNVLFDPEKGVAVKYLEGDFEKKKTLDGSSELGRRFRLETGVVWIVKARFWTRMQEVHLSIWRRSRGKRL